MAQFQTTWRVVDQIDTNCRPTKAGDPQVGVRTDKGEWIKVSGKGILKVKVGNKIEISEPSQFGKSWYARLCAIETTPQKPKPEEPKQEASPAANSAKPSSNGNGKIPWKDFAAFVVQTHTMLREVEPDGFNEGGVTVDRSAARATMFNTCVMALERGQIGTPDSNDDPTPF